MIKGAVIFGRDRFMALSQAMKQVVEANPLLDLQNTIYERPATLRFVQGDDPRGGLHSNPLPDRWFIHWDQLL